MRHLLLPLMLCVVLGCGGLVSHDPARKNPLKPKGIDDVKEFKGGKVVDQKVEITNPITGPLEAFEPTKQKIAILQVEHAVNIFNAMEGRYPKDHDEFMEKVIKANQIKLPEPARGFSYQYDVDNHVLLVVEEPKKKAEK